MASDSPEGFHAALFELQLRVARRADELAREQPDIGGLQLHCWLLSEEELLHKVDGGVSPSPPRAGAAED